MTLSPVGPSPTRSAAASGARDESVPGGDIPSARRILSNGVALLFAYLLPRVFTFTSVVVAARTLGTENFGAYGTAAAFAVILSIVATLGMVPLLVREIARAPERAPGLIRAAHVVKSISNVVMLGALLLLSGVVLDYGPQVTRAALLLGVGYALGAYAENLSAYFQAVERMHVWTQASALFGLVSGGAGVAIVLVTGDLVLFCAAPALGWAVALAWLLASAPADVRSGPRADRADMTRLLREIAPFALAFVLLTVYYKVDILLLARWRDATEVGVYAAAYKFIDLFQALMVVASAAVFPRLSRAAAERKDGRRWAGSRSTELLLLLSIPVAGGLYLLAGPMIGLLFGVDYVGSTASLQTLAATMPFLAMTIHGGYVLAAAERMLAVAGLYAGGIVLNVSLNRAFIPTLGAGGSALAMLISEAALAVGFACVLWRVAFAAPSGRVLAACSAGAGAAWLVSRFDGAFGSVFGVALFLVAVTTVYTVFGVFGRSEFRLLWAALRPAGASTV